MDFIRNLAIDLDDEVGLALIPPSTGGDSNEKGDDPDWHEDAHPSMGLMKSRSLTRRDQSGSARISLLDKATIETERVR